MKRAIFAWVLAVLCVASLTGCGSANTNHYEKAITGSARSGAAVPSSFVKKAYKEDNKNGLAFISYYDLNDNGNTVSRTAYYAIGNNNFHRIDTTGIPPGVIQGFYDKAPGDFQNCISFYRKLKPLARDAEYWAEISDNGFTRIRGSTPNLTTWRGLQREAQTRNNSLKEFNEVYQQAPDPVKDHFKKAAGLKYMNVNITDAGSQYLLNVNYTDSM